MLIIGNKYLFDFLQLTIYDWNIYFTQEHDIHLFCDIINMNRRASTVDTTLQLQGFMI